MFFDKSFSNQVCAVTSEYKQEIGKLSV